MSERYRIERRIGVGGMAEIFEAFLLGAQGFERRVAIKRMLAANVADEQHARMFLDEARIASNLHHANIVAVLDYGILDGLPFQVLDLVDGIDARRLIAQEDKLGRRVPEVVALHVCAEIARALDYAHEASDARGRSLGIVHRDVTPANILLSWTGDVKLTDFGIAKARERSERTATGGMKGTLAYMAPEQALGTGVDRRSDVFSLGCVLHALLSGKSAREVGDDLTAFLLTLAEGHDLALAPALPEDLRAIIAQATRADRSRRFVDARALGGALTEAIARRGVVDPRAELVRVLEAKKPAKATQGRFDQLLQFEIVLTESTEELRRFRASDTPRETREAGETAPGPIDPALAPTRLELVPTQAEPPEPKAPSGRRGALRAVVALALAASVALGVVAVQRKATSRPASVTAVAQIPATATPSSTTPPLPVDVPSATASVAPEETRGSASAAASVVLPPPRPLSTGSGATPASASTAPPSAAAGAPSPPTSGGVVAIGGEGARRGEILIDGRSYGFAPKRVELPIGTHSLVLVTPDGKRLGPSAVVVTARNTPSSPLVVRFD